MLDRLERNFPIRFSSLKRLTAKPIAVLLGAALAFSLTGCAGASGDDAESSKQADKDVASLTGSSSDTSTNTNTVDLDLEFSDRDLNPSYDEATAINVKLAGDSAEASGEGVTVEGSTVTFSTEGTYIVAGSLDNGQLMIDAGDEDKLQIVLNGASIHNENGPAFYVNNADKVFITLAAGSDNQLSDGKEYVLDGEDDNRNAALFSRDDLTINGEGSLSVTGTYHHAISSKDDLVIAGGTLLVKAEEDALRGKDAIKIANGSITVNAGDDAFHSEYLFYAKDGSNKVESCYEGYEAEKIIIDGGTHEVIASDDALNAAVADTDDTTDANTSESGIAEDASDPSNVSGAPQGRQFQGEADGQMPQKPQMSNGQGPSAGNGIGDPQGSMPESSSECFIQINEGQLTLTGGADAIDSNGNVEINGGTVLACGPTKGMDGSFDYDLNGQINGGTVVMLGSVGSTQGMDQSEQAWTIANVNGSKGQEVSVIGNGKDLAMLSASIDFSNVLVSSPDISEGDTFTIKVGDAQTEVVMTASATTEAPKDAKPSSFSLAV